MPRAVAAAALLPLCRCAAAAGAGAASGGDPGACTRVLFVGNSLTYGPRADGQEELNNLPRLFKLVAQSLGKCVTVDEDTVSACTLHAHRPSVSPDGCAPCKCPGGSSTCCPGRPTECTDGDGAEVDTGNGTGQCVSCGCTCQLVQNKRTSSREGCTLGNKSITANQADYRPCPQLLTRSRWDWVVLQDHSVLPTVAVARARYLLPAVAEYAARARGAGAKVAMYMTHAYYNGSHGECPGGDGGQAGCWPFGTMNGLIHDDPGASCKAWAAGGPSFACHTYALARGYAQAALGGAHALAPCGLAWHAARGAPPVAADCAAAVDAEYGPAAPTGLPPLPLARNGSRDGWAGAKGQQLYRYGGSWYHPQNHYCEDDCHIDLHASVLGMYLNALVFYATLFRASPAGAARPQGQVVDGMRVPGRDAVRGDGAAGEVTAAEAALLQHYAEETVLPYIDTWNPR